MRLRSFKLSLAKEIQHRVSFHTRTECLCVLINPPFSLWGSESVGIIKYPSTALLCNEEGGGRERERNYTLIALFSIYWDDVKVTEKSIK